MADDDRAVQPGPIDDDELTALALAADPDSPVAADAVDLWAMERAATGGMLPAWYMPAVSGRGRRRAWVVGVAVLLIAAFLAIAAAGLCNTYGELVPS